MNSLTQFTESYKILIYYIISLSVLRGLIIPDFRYGYFSIAVIQLAYPILLLMPLLIGKWGHPGYWGYFLLGFIGIVLSVAVAVSRYVWEFEWNALTSVSGAIFILSFAAMIVVFAVILVLLVAYSRH